MSAPEYARPHTEGIEAGKRLRRRRVRRGNRCAPEMLLRPRTG